MLNFALVAAILTLFFGAGFYLNKKHPLAGCLNYPIAFAVTVALIGYLYYLSLLFVVSYDFLLICIILIPASFLIPSLLREKGLAFSLPKCRGAGNMLILAIGILILTLRFNKQLHRWGDWDAWAIWTLHAKFLFYPEYWSNMFTNKLSGSHPDYPLMLPSLIAFMWRGVGFVTPIVPMIVASLVCVAVPVTLFLALNRFDRRFSAIFSVFVLALDAKFINIAGSQYADTLVAFFILVTFVLYREVKNGSGPTVVFLLGFIAGSTTWVKNEGLLFFLVFSCAFIFFHYRRPETAIRYLAGGLAPVLILMHFKLAFAPENDLINSGRGSDILAMIVNPARYMLIAKHVFVTSINYYWILLVLLAGLVIQRTSFLTTLPFIVFALMLSGYFVIYLTTPNDLDWHLGASLDRLLHHIYPACLYLALFRLSSSSGVRLNMPDYQV